MLQSNCDTPSSTLVATNVQLDHLLLCQGTTGLQTTKILHILEKKGFKFGYEETLSMLGHEVAIDEAHEAGELRSELRRSDVDPSMVITRLSRPRRDRCRQKAQCIISTSRNAFWCIYNNLRSIVLYLPLIDILIPWHSV